MAIPIEISGTESFKAPPERVFAALTDLDRVRELIPDLVSAERDPDGSLRCVVRPGFAFIRGTLKLTIRLTESTPSEHARLEINSAGIGMSMKMESTLKVIPEGSGARLDWAAAIIERKGLIAAVSAGLIRGAAEQTVRDGWRKLHAMLG